MSANKNTLHKSERLCGEIRIAQLFTQGNAFIAFPFRIVYLIGKAEAEPSLKVLFSAPKKRFKRAVTRNHFKRLMREAYRTNKHELKKTIADNQLEVQIAFSFVGDKNIEWLYIEQKMQSALHKFETIVHDYLLNQQTIEK